MDPAISDLALDLGQFALDNELEKERKRTQPIARLEARQTGFATIRSPSAAAKSSSTTSVSSSTRPVILDQRPFSNEVMVMPSPREIPR
jgi:hypothetical protein